MIKIRNKEFNNESVELKIKTSIYNKNPIKVLDLWIKYDENNNKITHYFEGFLNVEEIKN